MAKHDAGRTVRLLQTFATVARNHSVSKAAAELGVTTSAVSHQIKDLSATLGEKLVERSGRGIAFTRVGLKLANELDDAFERIEQSVRETIGGRSKSIRIAVCSSFGPSWLASRFSNLARHLTDVELSVILYTQSPELTDEVADVFVTTRSGDPGYWSMSLFEERVLAVGRTSDDIDLARFDSARMITTEIIDGSTGTDWRDFAKATGVNIDFSQQKAWLKCSHYLLAMEFAKQGAGIALVPDFLAREDIASGKLRKHWETPIANGRQYFLCIKKSRRREVSLQRLVSWFRQQIQASS